MDYDEAILRMIRTHKQFAGLSFAADESMRRLEDMVENVKDFDLRVKTGAKFALDCLRKYDPEEKVLENILVCFLNRPKAKFSYEHMQLPQWSVVRAAYKAKQSLLKGTPQDEALKDLLVLWPEFDYSLLEEK